MKRIIIIILCCVGIIISCSTPELPLPEVLAKDDIFSVKESSVTNGQSIHFDLPSSGVYTLSLIDNSTNQVVSRERFNGQSGENVKKIYTKTLPSRYLSIVLSDANKNIIKQTKIIVN